MWLLEGPVELLDADETLSVIRQGDVVDTDVLYVDGVAVAAAAPTTFEITCTVQPMQGKDLLLVPEAFRQKESLWLWQEHYDQGPDTLRVTLNDIVVRLGRAYQVQTAEDWGSYTHAILVAVDVGTLTGEVDAAAPPPLFVDDDADFIP